MFNVTKIGNQISNPVTIDEAKHERLRRDILRANTSFELRIVSFALLAECRRLANLPFAQQGKARRPF